MIHYNLKCEKGHEFDGWFRSSDDYDKQRKRRLVACPSCGTAKVEKALMAPRVVPSDKQAKRPRRQDPAPTATPSPAEPPQSLVASPEQREVMSKLRALRDEVLKKSEYVGPRFADEARKIHTNESPERGIHGEASPAEVKALVDDGIDVYPVPVLPDDKN